MNNQLPGPWVIINCACVWAQLTNWCDMASVQLEEEVVAAMHCTALSNNNLNLHLSSSSLFVPDTERGECEGF